MKPVVGVSTSERGGWRSFLAIRIAIWRAGGRARRITPHRAIAIDEIDALIAGGGDDISAELYGATVVPNVRTDPARDAHEAEFIPEAVDRGLPVLGICRGSQMINVAFGGSLHQDIYKVYIEAPRMRTVLPRKRVTVAPRSRLAGIIACLDCRVNALHHQSVDRLGTGLSVSAFDRHEMIQAIEAEDGRPVLGVQWHPELMPFARGQTNLFRWLVRHAAAAQEIASGRLVSQRGQSGTHRRSLLGPRAIRAPACGPNRRMGGRGAYVADTSGRTRDET